MVCVNCSELLNVALVDHFGREILTKEGRADRVALGQRIFQTLVNDWSNRVQGRLIREAPS